MPRCPKCKRSFRTLEDEPLTECPHCGYGDDDRPVTYRAHACDAGERCTKADRLIGAGYDAKGRIVDLEPGITITVSDDGPTFRHTGCPDLALERFIAEQKACERFDELMGFALGPKPE